MAERGPHRPVRVYVDLVGDLFHAGHVALLREARTLGDELVVGVLSDGTAASYKRAPVMSLAERVAVVGSCRYVDEVLADAPFALTTDFLDQHAISVVVHGDDLPDDAVRAIYGPALDRGAYVALPRQGDLSTTHIIQRVLDRHRGDQGG